MSIAKIHSIANQITDEYTRRAVELLIDLMFSGDVGLDDDGKAELLKKGGTEITASAAELNAAATYVDDLDVPVAEMNSGYALIGALAGTGGAGSAAFDTTGPVEVVAANLGTDEDRACLIIVECTQAFSEAGGGTHAKFEIGDNVSAAEFATIGEGGTPDESMGVGERAVFTAVLQKERSLEIAITQGHADAGAIQVYVIALDVEA